MATEPQTRLADDGVAPDPPLDGGEDAGEDVPAEDLETPSAETATEIDAAEEVVAEPEACGRGEPRVRSRHFRRGSRGGFWPRS